MRGSETIGAKRFNFSCFLETNQYKKVYILKKVL
jgi:hypothetical protein